MKLFLKQHFIVPVSIITALSVFLSFTLLAHAITFTSEGYVEVPSAMRGTVCIVSGDACVPGSEKPILFGIAFVFPDRAIAQSEIAAGNRGFGILLTVFEGKMFRQTRGGRVQSRPFPTVPTPGAQEEDFYFPNLWEAEMSILNPDGSEILKQAKTTFTYHRQNPQPNDLSDLTITVGGTTYNLVSIQGTANIQVTIEPTTAATVLPQQQTSSPILDPSEVKGQ